MARQSAWIAVESSGGIWRNFATAGVLFQSQAACFHRRRRQQRLALYSHDGGPPSCSVNRGAPSTITAMVGVLYTEPVCLVHHLSGAHDQPHGIRGRNVLRNQSAQLQGNGVAKRFFRSIRRPLQGWLPSQKGRVYALWLL